MKSHAWRPLYVVIALVVLILIVRVFYVPRDFGVWERGYMYGYHDKDNEEWWKQFKVKYKFDSEYCKDCHGDKYESMMKTPHAMIQCENCHGPVLEHPSDPPKLHIDKSREQCLRCHYPLPYFSSGRADIRGVDPEKHNPGVECSMCHNPHNPSLEGLK
ncbi:MAG TPA: cytochrome c3 family protein [Thermodesulfovibrionales bacterium]|nr:cytochrome c3 family protein [Thermodesulfovibrionales bacterium]